MPYIGQEPITGNFIKLDTISVVNGQAAYTMQKDSVNFSPASANQMLVSLNGIIQNPTSSFTISGSTITFASNLVTGDVINFILVLGDVLNVGTPSDNTVTNDKLATAPTLISKGAGSDSGAIQLNCEQNSHGVKIKGPPHSASQSYTLTLPSTAPAANKMLQSDGSGNLSFIDAPSGGLKFLNRTTISSSTTFCAFNNTYINSTYDDYFCIFNLRNSADNEDLGFKVSNNTFINSSVMRWSFAQDIYQKFANNSDTYFRLYKGIDRFIYNENITYKYFDTDKIVSWQEKDYTKKVITLYNGRYKN